MGNPIRHSMSPEIHRAFAREAGDDIESTAIDTTVPLIERIRTSVEGRLPIAVGFGVSSPEHVRELAPVADGIIVGSAIVAALDDGGAPRVRTFVAGLAAATAHAA